MREIGFIVTETDDEEIAARAVAGALPAPDSGPRLKRCPRCSQPAMILQENCDLCTSCGYSKCS